MLYNRRRLLLTPAERQGMREASRFNAQLMDEVRKIIRPGLATSEIDKLVEILYPRSRSRAGAARLSRTGGRFSRQLLHQRQRRHLPRSSRATTCSRKATSSTSI